MLYYEKISNTLNRIKLICSINVQEESLISRYEIDIYFELINKGNNNIIPLDKWIYSKPNKDIEDCFGFDKLKIVEKRDNIYCYNVEYNKETKNQMIKINPTDFLYLN